MFDNYDEDECKFLISVLKKDAEDYHNKLDIIEDLIDEIETSLVARKA